MTETPTDTIATEAEKGSAYVAGLRALADLLDANPDLAGPVIACNYRLLVPVSHVEDPRALMAHFIRAAKAGGHRISKLYDNDYGNVDIDLGGGLGLQVYALREQVCERVVKGTHEVTREVPDPEALAAVPTTTVTETVEDVEWVCTPLLAPEPVAS